MKIKSIQIKGLWNTYDINLNLNDSVNVLSGINGCGKSTILDFVIFLLSHPKHKLPDYLAKRVKSIVIDTDKGTVYYESFNDNIKVSVSYAKVENRQLLDSEIYDYFKSFKLASIGTIDSISVYPDGTIDENGSSMNQILEALFRAFSFYNKKLEETVAKNILSKTKFDEIFGQRNLFVSIMNGFLKETGKEIVLTNHEPMFMVNGNKCNLLSYKDLSLGEKQILIIMLIALLQKKEEYVFCLDTPETSLHTDWQMVLIDKIRELNPNCQLIIATHAPSIILNGWVSCVQNIEDVRTVIK